MTWTTPMTAVANSTFTAAQFNTYVRDNLAETAPAKAAAAGQHFVATGTNAIAARLSAESEVLTSENCTNASYSDLTTVGPQVVAVTGTAALVWIARSASNSVGAFSGMSFAVSGATTLAASDNRCVGSEQPNPTSMQAGNVFRVPLTAGSNTFTAKYRAAAGSTGFAARRLGVFPL